jgi:ATP adenylyltransferase
MTSTTCMTLLERSDQVARDALACGALQPIRTLHTTLCDGDIEFSVRWVSSLALKDQARIDTVIRRAPDFNPFLPPEPALTVAALGDAHLVVLNKFPVIDRHLLIVTRDWEAQTATLTLADFSALAAVIGAHRGLGFYNGGLEAGASQAHKHLQWVPRDPGAEPALQGLFVAPGTRPGVAGMLETLRWRHAFVALAADTWLQPDTAAVQLQAAFAAAWRLLGLVRHDDLPPTLPPYNLLVTRDWLLLVPRRCEKWHDVSINALGFAGSLFVRSHAQIERLRSAGPLAVLAAVSQPR